MGNLVAFPEERKLQLGHVIQPSTVKTFYRIPPSPHQPTHCHCYVMCALHGSSTRDLTFSSHPKDWMLSHSETKNRRNSSLPKTRTRKHNFLKMKTNPLCTLSTQLHHLCTHFPEKMHLNLAFRPSSTITLDSECHCSIVGSFDGVPVG